MTDHRPARGRAVLLAAALAVAGLSPSAAAAADVGYVVSLTGTAEIEVDKTKGELSFLDFLPDGSRLRLGNGTELRVCHNAAGLISSVTGPAVVRVSGRELVSEGGQIPVRTGERCNAPLVSNTQGGTAFRSLRQPPPAVDIGVRTWLRVKAGSRTAVAKATLMSPDETSRISEFRTISMSPVVLNAGSIYPLLVEFADGRKLTVRLAARDGVAAEVAVINVAP